jgi:Immunity protein 26
MNLQPLKPSRKKQSPGDIFAMRLVDDRYLFGRVISTEAKAGWSLSGSILIYIYRVVVDGPELPPMDQLTRDNLLVPPIMTNALPWSKGYFETVAQAGLAATDVLSRHCFRSSSGKYYDEKCVELAGEVQPCGDWGLHSFRTIDDEISYALGIARAE